MNSKKEKNLSTGRGYNENKRKRCDIDSFKYLWSFVQNGGLKKMLCIELSSSGSNGEKRLVFFIQQPISNEAER